MSIQSEINRISSEVTTQTDLLGQIAAELAGKAAGGDIEIQTDKEAVTPSNVAQTVWPDSGYDALAKVTVKAIPSEYIVPSGTVSITENGVHNVREAESVNVNVTGTGIDTSDATATADDVAYGKTAYVDGEKIKGNVVVLDENLTLPINNASWEDGDIVSKFAPVANLLIRKDVELIYSVQGSLFGTATADDVAKGKTFTSASGLKITGIKEEASGGGLPSGISAIATGTVTPASDAGSIMVNHNLGVLPNFAAYVVLGDYSTFAKKGAAYASFFYRSSNPSYVLSEKTLSFFYDPTTGEFDSSAQELNSTLTTTQGSLIAATEGSFLQGREYFWIVAKIDNAL